MNTRTWARTKGVAAVEMALLLIPLVVMVFGMTELGRAFYYYDGLMKASRNACRYLSMYAHGENEAQARCLAVYGTATCPTDPNVNPLVPGFDPSMVGISYQLGVSTGHGSVDLVRVSINGFPYTSFVPGVVSNMVFGPIACTMRQGAA